MRPRELRQAFGSNGILGGLKMHKLIKGLVIVSIAVLAGCQTAPVPVAPKVAAPEAQPLPYRWTHGNAEKARQAMIDNFRRAWLATGDFVWAEQIPAEGDPKIIIDLLTQTAYAYKGDVLVGAASISSAPMIGSSRFCSSAHIARWRVFRSSVVVLMECSFGCGLRRT